MTTAKEGVLSWLSMHRRTPAIWWRACGDINEELIWVGRPKDGFLSERSQDEVKNQHDHTRGPQSSRGN